MFVSNLNFLQQGKLLSLANRLIREDGKLDQREEAIFDNIKSQCLVGVEAEETSVLGLAGIFTTRKERVSLLLELIGVALVDREYHGKEAEMIKEIAQELAVTEDLQEMELWVEKQFKLVSEANEMMEVN